MTGTFSHFGFLNAFKPPGMTSTAFGGWVKRLLLIDSERDKRAYAIGCAVLLIGLYGGIVWASWSH